MSPSRDTFRAFLKSGSAQFSGVTGVTGVTANKNKNLDGHTAQNKSVTGVTEIAGSFPASSDVDERQAIAETEGGVPPLYSHGFACLQLTPLPGLSVQRWLQAVDDAGTFLDVFGQHAQATGWRSEDLFRHDGLVLTLRGARVTKLSATVATLSDGRTFKRFE